MSTLFQEYRYMRQQARDARAAFQMHAAEQFDRLADQLAVRIAFRH